MAAEAAPSQTSPPPKKSKPKHVEPLLDTTVGPWLPFIEVNFPPFALVKDHHNRIILGGGGGRGRTGVPNKLIIIEVADEEYARREDRIRAQNARGAQDEQVEDNLPVAMDKRKKKEPSSLLMRKVCVYDTGEQAVMNLALHPTENLLACGVEDRCRIYNIGHKAFQPIGEVVSDYAENEEDRGQKRVRFGPRGDCLFTCGGDGFVRMFSFPALTLERTFDAHALEKDKETIDLSITGRLLAVSSRTKCLVYSLDSGALLTALTPSKPDLQFRDCRFCPIGIKEDHEDDDDGRLRHSGGSSSNLESFTYDDVERLLDDADADSLNSIAKETSSKAGGEDALHFDDGLDEARALTAFNAAHKSSFPVSSVPRPDHQAPGNIKNPKRKGSSPPSPNAKQGDRSQEEISYTYDTRYLYLTEFKPQQMSVIRKVDIKTGFSVVATQTLRFKGDHGTALNISDDGSTLVLGTVEGQLRVLRADNLKEVKSWKESHEFFVTDFVFMDHRRLNTQDPPQTRKLAPRQALTVFSASGDNTIRATELPLVSQSSSRLVALFSLLFSLLLFIGIGLFVFVYLNVNFARESDRFYVLIGSTLSRALGRDLAPQTQQFASTAHELSQIVYDHGIHVMQTVVDTTHTRVDDLFRAWFPQNP